MPQLHGFNNTIHNQRGTETGSEPEEKHLAALITPQGLHGRIIDDLHRAAEGGFKVKSDPPLSEVIRLCYGPTPQNGSRIADRYHVILPIANQLLDSGDHLFRRHVRLGRELPTLRFACGEELAMCPADINNEHVQIGSLRPSSSPEDPEGVILGTINLAFIRLPPL